ncbi:MAG: Co2+/Mg2+ efflux protein ApaG [Marinirhabdus sp.]
MNRKTTNGVLVTATPNFEGAIKRNHRDVHAFSYRITVTNNSESRVQLMSRHWIIMDALNLTQEVKGDGVIGLQPVLEPGGSHTYSSGCLLRSPLGSMRGAFSFLNLDLKTSFKVAVPRFKLVAAFAMN